MEQNFINFIPSSDACKKHILYLLIQVLFNKTRKYLISELHWTILYPTKNYLPIYQEFYILSKQMYWMWQRVVGQIGINIWINLTSPSNSPEERDNSFSKTDSTCSSHHMVSHPTSPSNHAQCQENLKSHIHFLIGQKISVLKENSITPQKWYFNHYYYKLQ